MSTVLIVFVLVLIGLDFYRKKREERLKQKQREKNNTESFEVFKEMMDTLNSDPNRYSIMDKEEEEEYIRDVERELEIIERELTLDNFDDDNVLDMDDIQIINMDDLEEIKDLKKELKKKELELRKIEENFEREREEFLKEKEEFDKEKNKINKEYKNFLTNGVVASEILDKPKAMK